MIRRCELGGSVPLTDNEIRTLLGSGELNFSPLRADQIRGSSVDLRLDSFARVVRKGAALDVKMPSDQLAAHFENVTIGEAGYVLQPRELLIGQTMENIKVPVTTQGNILQRSSLVRLGLQVTSSILNPGYQGNLPLLIVNLTEAAIRIEAGMLICQIVLLKLSDRPMMTYLEQPGAKYFGETEFRISKISEDARFAKYERDLEQITASAVATAEEKGFL